MAREVFPLGPVATPPRGRALLVALAAFFLLAALGLPVPPQARVALALAAFATFGGLTAEASRRKRARENPKDFIAFDRSATPTLSVHVLGRTLLFSEFAAMPLVAYDERDAQLAIADATTMIYLPVALADAPAVARAAWLARAHAVPRSDATNGAATTPAMEASVALRLLETLAIHAPRATTTVLASTVQGECLRVDPTELTLEHSAAQTPIRVDLCAPFDLRTFTFRERFGEGTLISQAISVIQGEISLVFVAPLPAEFLGARGSQEPMPQLGPRAEASVRALIAAKDEPPPPAGILRRALDRPLMAPLRALLATAHAHAHVLGSGASPERDHVDEPRKKPRSEPITPQVFGRRSKGRELLS